jgi:hypothetical protein
MKNLNDIQCFKCKEMGHCASSCPKNSEKVNLLKNEKVNKGLDSRKVLVNGRPINAIFDTGADVSIITSKLLDKFDNVTYYDTDKKFILVDGSSVKSIKKVNLNVKYEEKKIEEMFYVIKNDLEEIMLLSNNFVRKTLEKIAIPIKCQINTKESAPVSWTRGIRSQKDKQDFEKLVIELEKKGIVEESNSMWLNPVVLVRKKNGDLRFCVDFRKLNDLVEQDHYLIPKIHELMYILNDQKFFSKIDLRDGFYHIEIIKQDREKTAFYSGRRLLQFVKMPQGFKNSPAVFQRAMEYIFRDLLNVSCIIYIDDILVFGRTEKEHDENFLLVLNRLKKYDMKINEEKTVKKVEKIEFLGFESSHNKIKPTLSRCQGIVDYKEPRNKKELHRFIGIVNYDRCFVKNITEHLKIFYSMSWIV